MRIRLRFKRRDVVQVNPDVPVVTFVSVDTILSEPSDTATVLVQRTGPTTNPLTVLYSIGGTAQNGVDYNEGSPLTGSVIIPAGQASAPIDISPFDDDEIEVTETVVLTLTPDVAYSLGAVTNVVVLLLDDDTAGPVSDHPHMLVPGQAGAEAVRAQLATDADFLARWTTGVGQFTESGSVWSDPTPEPDAVPYNYAVAAFLTAIRRSGDDLGIPAGTWGATWQEWYDKIVAWAYADFPTGPKKDGSIGTHAIALALIYDNLEPDMTAQEKQDFQEWLEEGYSQNEYMTGLGVEVWDGGAAIDHFAKAFSALASENFEARLGDAFLYSMRIVDAYDWMPMGFGLGRDLHRGTPRAYGLPMLLLAIKNAGGYSDAQTFDRFRTHLRDNWWIVRHAVIPHPNSATAQYQRTWYADKFHTQDARIQAPFDEICGAFMINALACLRGTVNLNGAGISNQPTLAANEEAFWGYLRSQFDQIPAGESTSPLRAVVNAKFLGAADNFQARFWCFPSWWILNAQESPAVVRATAGIPNVRRFGQGTLEWTFIESPDFSEESGTVVRHTYRRYGASPYEEGTRQNGRWHAHRNGPLYIQGGETGHGLNTRKNTAQANGALLFIDEDLYDPFELPNLDDEDGCGARVMRGPGGYKDAILGNPLADFCETTAWHADDKVVAITADLTRTYNSSGANGVTTGTGPKNAAKVTSAVRESLTIQHGADGTTRVTVVTYDRIALAEQRFRPAYALVTGPPPDIDGVETAVTPQAPDAIPTGQNDPLEQWTASGPNRWDYTAPTRLLVDNTSEPAVPTVGTGKGQTTWLEPSGANAFVRRNSGLNNVSPTRPAGSGTPGMTALGGWQSKADWAKHDALAERAYVGTSASWLAPVSWGTDVVFHVATDLMDAVDTPATVEALTADAGSAAARCGARAWSFSVSGAARGTCSMTIPAGVSFIVLVNMTPNATLDVTPTGLAIESANRLSSSTGVLWLETDGAAGSIAVGSASGAVLTEFFNIGGVTDDEATFAFRLNKAGTGKIRWSENSDMSGATTTSGVSATSATDFAIQVTATGLPTNTVIHYEVLVDDVEQFQSSFKTLPAEDDDAAVTIAVISCHLTPDQETISAAVEAANPDLVVHLGDDGYADVTTVDGQRLSHRAQRVLGSAMSEHLFKKFPVEKIWSDHDYGQNNGNGDMPNKANALQVFKEIAATYPLTSPSNGIWRESKIGNIHNFFLDTRYQREGSRPRYPDAAGVYTDASHQAVVGATTNKVILPPSGAGQWAIPGSMGGQGQWFLGVEGGSAYKFQSYNSATREITLTENIAGVIAGQNINVACKRASMLDMNGAGASGQLEWLIDGVLNSTSRWQVIYTDVVVNPTFNIFNQGADDSWGGWAQGDQFELTYLLRRIASKANVGFVSGDRHYSAIDDGANSVRWELVSSPFDNSDIALTGGATWSHGSNHSGRKFALLTFGVAPHQVTLSVKSQTGAVASGITDLTVEAA